MSGISNLGFLLILLTALLSSVANFFLRKGVENAGGFTIEGIVITTKNFINLFTTPLFFLGFLLYIGATLFWVRIISSEPINLAYPLLVSISFILVTFGTTFFLEEPLLTRNVIGIFLIILGIFLVSGW